MILANRFLIIFLALFFFMNSASYSKTIKPSQAMNSNTSSHITKSKFEKTILAGGCFWGMEELLRSLDGVVSTRVGYTGGKVPNATYDIVKTGLSGHAESVEVTYDPARISYEKLLKFFFTIHDPTTTERQGNDVGSQYRSEIFYFTEEQKKIAEDVIRQGDASKKFPGKIVTKVEKAGEFYAAEEYHQDYLQKNPYGYTCHHPRKEWKF